MRDPLLLMSVKMFGSMLDQHNIRRGFRQITRAAGLGDEWDPRELRPVITPAAEIMDWIFSS